MWKVQNAFLMYNNKTKCVKQLAKRSFLVVSLVILRFKYIRQTFSWERYCGALVSALDRGLSDMMLCDEFNPNQVQPFAFFFFKAGGSIKGKSGRKPLGIKTVKWEACLSHKQLITGSIPLLDGKRGLPLHLCHSTSPQSWPQGWTPPPHPAAMPGTHSPVRPDKPPLVFGSLR